MLEINISKKAGKFLSKCEDEFYKRIIEKIKKLSENPFPQDCKRIQGRQEKLFRIRIGQYRLIYEIINNKILLISEIDKRDRIYK